MDLRGKTIIITGGSSGIGAATARACAAAGMHVVVTARRGDRLATLVDEIDRAGGRAHAIEGDVVDPTLDTRLLEASRRVFGGFDAVFANAGYTALRHQLEETDAEQRHMFEVNFFSATRLLKRAASELVAAERPGHLLMCSSCVSKFSLPGHGTYTATNAAQDHVCRAMRLELSGRGIRVSSVHPVTTRTELFDVSAEIGGRPKPAGGLPSHAVPLFTQTPERVAQAVVRCLRRPRPEVWTSLTTRLAAALFTAFPRFGDFVLRRQTIGDGSDDE